MSSDLRYPRIMEPGQLRALNEYVISKVGIPVFFATPEPARPHASDACGRLYEIITGLYIIYHDYGIRFLSKYLKFADENYLLYGSRGVLAHFNSILDLRGGFCHGSLPDGGQAAKMMRRMDYYFPGTDQTWPGMLPRMSEQQCAQMVKSLSDSSDKLYAFVKTCADYISQNSGWKESWKKIVLSDVLNKNVPKYRDFYFDGRVLDDVASAYSSGKTGKSYQLQVKQWVTEMEGKIQAGTLSTDDLHKSLMRTMEEVYHPSVQQSKKTSADLFADWF